MIPAPGTEQRDVHGEQGRRYGKEVNACFTKWCSSEPSSTRSQNPEAIEISLEILQSPE